ncbi:DUF4232 domain-containing protein [Streptomyces olivochromogenes]|uniref:DUF4232 domain-containing protein n=1 Tax=Streptomyces olivochromogenes TaxID=1963 RepID=UPI001F1C157A|nr:DUF4232 domain-containing protein [Streptomyces olivochromogenes]MCF3131179.1 DUF4232 domain-containing protein [Streptomyces olivochromogenes]
MRLRTATFVTAAVFVASLSLTACNSGTDEAKTEDTSSPVATASPTSKASATAGTSTGKTGGSQASATAAGSAGSGSGGGAVSACTTKTTTVQFIASAAHASESEPATATVKVTNTSGSTCTIVGATSLTAKDDQGKADPIETDNSAAGTDSVDLAPGASATADVLYTDLNFDGSQSAREVCAVQASKVEIALPKDVARTVKVTKASGSTGIFNVCTQDVKFGSFHS